MSENQDLIAYVAELHGMLSRVLTDYMATDDYDPDIVIEARELLDRTRIYQEGDPNGNRVA